MSGPPGVEDPISAIFDLSDRVAQIAPTVRRMYRYTATIVTLWTIIVAIVAVLTVGSSPIIAVLAIAGFAVGVIGLSLLRETDRFFRGFVQRHRQIRLVRDAEPIVAIPDGRTPIERLVRHLAGTSDAIGAVVRDDPGSVQYRVSYPAGGRSIGFDLVIVRPGGVLYRVFGRGFPGFAVLGRIGAETTGLEELQRLESDAAAAAPRLAGAPARLVLLRPRGNPLAPDVYEWAVGHPNVIGVRLGKYRSATQIVTENTDRTYDIVPHLIGVP